MKENGNKASVKYGIYIGKKMYDEVEISFFFTLNNWENSYSDDKHFRSELI